MFILRGAPVPKEKGDEKIHMVERFLIWLGKSFETDVPLDCKSHQGNITYLLDQLHYF